MANKTTARNIGNFGWSTFKSIPGSASKDIRKGAHTIQIQVERESKIFASASLLNGGTKITSVAASALTQTVAKKPAPKKTR